MGGWRKEMSAWINKLITESGVFCWTDESDTGNNFFSFQIYFSIWTQLSVLEFLNVLLCSLCLFIHRFNHAFIHSAWGSSVGSLLVPGCWGCLHGVNKKEEVVLEVWVTSLLYRPTSQCCLCGICLLWAWYPLGLSAISIRACSPSFVNIFPSSRKLQCAFPS